ncbi:MAG: bifunctional phosphoglucose/phosphomannose isomerase [bacterium]
MVQLKLDTLNMHLDLAHYTDQMTSTLLDIEQWQYTNTISNIHNIVFCGMGGSAIGADLVRALVADQLSVPMITLRDYSLPNFVNEHSLVFTCSFSGGTEETLACFHEARKRNASIITLSSGGELEKLSTENQIPFFKINYKSHCGQPRVNSGVMITAILGILEKLNLITFSREDINESIKLITDSYTKWNPELTTDTPPLPLQLAEKIKQHIPIVHGSGLTASIALRWKQDISETGKHTTSFETIPECNHNALVGYEFPTPLGDNVFMLALRSSFEHPRNTTRWNIMKEIWQQRNLPFEEVSAQGSSKLSQLFYLVYLGMCTSFYLGLLHNIDPTPVNVISFIKDALAKT